MIDPSKYEDSLKRMALTGAAIVVALMAVAGLIGYWIGGN